jgi:hypothetical protein
MKYEDFIQDERAVLMKTCQAMNLSWDEGMISWPKRSSEIAYVHDEPNETFIRSIDKGSLMTAKLQDKAQIQIDHLPRTELEWLEDTFSAYNDFHGYPKKIRRPQKDGAPISMAAPRFEGTAREWYYSEIERLRSEYWRLISENERLRGEIERLLDEKERLG